MRIPSLLAAVLLAVAPLAFATPQSRNATDIWFNAAESGWGLNLIHQGDTIFGSLFVYGPDGQPKWYFASGLTGGGDAYSGPLYESTGPWFGGDAFNPASVQTRQVGTMALALADGAATAEYTIDGVRVTKQITRYTFRRTTLQGRYEGYMLQPAAGGGEVGRTDLTLVVSDDGSSFSMDTSSDSQSPCLYTGTPAQDGQFESVSGSFSCSGGNTGTWSMRVDPTTEGFTGTFSGNGINGRIAAARMAGEVSMRGHGVWNDLWFDPREAGWGLNIIEQGDTLFASLFVYDAQGRPRWYSAPDMRLVGASDDDSVTYSGALVESTGPYFGTSFNPAAVTRRTVGEMTFRARPSGRGQSLSYSVDGTQVSKLVERFTFRKENFSGSYLGSYAHDRQAMIAIDDDGSDFRMQLVDRFGGSGTCIFLAPFSQWGSLRTMSGTFSCTGGESGPFTMRYATVGAHGFTSRFDAPNFNFRPILNGHIGGVRR